MGDEHHSSPLGGPRALDARSASPGPIAGTFTGARPLGFDTGAQPLSGRKVSKVIRDWHPTPNPDTTPIKVQAANLKELAEKLSQLPEAGEGGGRLRSGPTETDANGVISVKLFGNLVNKAVEWEGYDQASAEAKAHWDKVLANLKRHEQRHMEIAIEEGDSLAALLIGHEVGSTPSIADKVTSANATMKQRQVDLDSAAESDHGKKVGHKYGDCNIDPTIP